VPRKPSQPKAARPNLAELDYEDDDASPPFTLDDDGNMVLRRSAKPKPTKGAKRGKGKEKPAR
jgi:hypothetical protein